MNRRWLQLQPLRHQSMLPCQSRRRSAKHAIAAADDGVSENHENCIIISSRGTESESETETETEEQQHEQELELELLARVQRG